MQALPRFALAPRLRPTPYSEAVDAAGASIYSVYNHMRLPVCFESFEADCAHLKSHVQIWDVAAQRQVQMRGPDAARLAQMVTPRDLGGLRAGACAYAPMVDAEGRLLNDPIAIRVSEDCWRLSIADSDVLLWLKGLALGCGLDVTLSEPDINPLAVQGPKALDLMVRLFGEELRRMRPFGMTTGTFEGQSHVITRSGWSKQGGFEIYVEGWEHAMPLWEALFDAGGDLNVRAGCPNLIERVESGLLSYGSDMTSEHTPYEAGLGQFCQPEKVDCIGRDALLQALKGGPQRQIRCLTLDGDRVPPLRAFWPVTTLGDRHAGRVSSATWSPEFGTNVAVAMIEKDHWDPGTPLVVHTPDGAKEARIRDGFYR